MKRPHMPRIDWLEPAVMLATVVQWLVLASLTGLVVGLGTSVFLRALFYMTDRSLLMPAWAYWLTLPFAGLANGLLMGPGYRVLETSGLKDSIFAAVHEQSGRMPWRTLWIKPVAAIITLASGGSAGKEGPCSHIGASLAAVVGRLFGLNAELRQRLVACGVSAGFASVFGTPIAGAIYGVEMLIIGRIRHDFLFPALVAGVTSFQVSKRMGIPYQYYFMDALPAFSESLFLRTILIGMLCGVCGTDVDTGVVRFTFGLQELADGVEIRVARARDGRKVRRVDDVRYRVGHARFSADVAARGLVFPAFLRGALPEIVERERAGAWVRRARQGAAAGRAG